MSKIELPELLSYPPILDFDDVLPELKSYLVYIIRGYPEQGIAVLIKRKNQEIYMQVGDWDANVIDMQKESMTQKTAQLILNRYGAILSNIMIYANIGQAIFYFSVTGDSPRLVDMRRALDNFVGPGFIRDIFSKHVMTQEILKVTPLTDQILKTIKLDTGSLSGDLMIKTSAFKTINRNNKLYPSYGKITRS